MGLGAARQRDSGSTRCPSEALSTDLALEFLALHQAGDRMQHTVLHTTHTDHNDGSIPDLLVMIGLQQFSIKQSIQNTVVIRSARRHTRCV